MIRRARFVLMHLTCSSVFASIPQARNSSHGIESLRQIVQCARPKGKLPFNFVRHWMYPLCRREHKTLGQRSPVTNVPMMLQSYSWREAIASILFPESGHAPWSEAEQPGRWGAWGLGGLLGQLGLGGASAGGIFLRVLARLEDNRAEAVLRAVKQNSVPESMRHRHIDYRSGRELPEPLGHSKGSKECANGVQSRARAPAYH